MAMGMDIACLLNLQEKGLLTPEKNKLFDVGPQNVYSCTAEQIVSFVRRQGAAVDGDTLEKEARRLEYFSTPRRQERTTFFSEIADLTHMEYHAIDVCPAPKTELLDLNVDALPDRHHEYYDVVLNFGTTEHIFNQWNSFSVIHDAVKVGGVIYCVVPATGYLDHGYFCYTPLFFKDMTASNEYELVEQFFAPAGMNIVSQLSVDLRAGGLFLEPNSGRLTREEDQICCLNAHVIMRKTKSAPFRCGLEAATSHSAVHPTISTRYRAAADLQRECERLYRETKQLNHEKEQLNREKEQAISERDLALMERGAAQSELELMRLSRSWRLTGPLRALRAVARRQGV
jgi:hypothetical protein